MGSKMRLKSARKRIDKVDKEIAELINRRAELALEAGKAKVKGYKEGEGGIYVPSREKEVLKNIVFFLLFLLIAFITYSYTYQISFLIYL